MKIIYFNIRDGRCVKPNHKNKAPQYRAITNGFKIISIERNFKISFIKGRGVDWLLSNIKREIYNWNYKYPSLLGSLKSLIIIESIKKLFSTTNHNHDNTKITYFTFWNKD